MGIFDDGYTQAVIDAARNPVERPPAGFAETFWQTYRATRQEDLSISERQNYFDKVRKRNDIIIEKTGGYLDNSGEPDPIGKLDLSDPTLNKFGQLSTTVERARLAYQKRIGELANQYSEIKTDQDLLKEIIEDSRRIREKTDSVLSNTTFSGKIGSFTGAMAASMTDPLVLATIPLGASTGAGILKTALIEGGYGMLSEAMIQPFVYRYKQKLGSPYDVSDAFTRIAAAGVGSAAIAGTVKGGFKLFSHLTRPRLEGIDDLLEAFDVHAKAPTDIQRDAAYVLGDYADVIRESPFVLGNPRADDVHLQATAKALADLDAGRPVDVSEIVWEVGQPEAVAGGMGFSGLPENFPRTIAGAAAPRAATENQSIAQFVKNSGGVSVEKAGALRGEYEALFEGGGNRTGAVKRKAGKSADEMAQLAHESGFIDEPDPVLLAEALDRDIRGNKVYSIQGDRFERKMDLEIERQYQRWVAGEEADYFKELELKARGILETQDIQLPTGELVESGGAVSQITRSAREILAEIDGDSKAGTIIRDCLIAG